MERSVAELLWDALRLGVLLSFSAAVRKSKSTVSTVFSVGGLACWCFYDLHRQLRRQRAQLWNQMAVPLRVCAYAEQLGEHIEPGSAKDWCPWHHWTLDSCSVQPVLQSDFAQAEAVRRFRERVPENQCLPTTKALLWGNDWSEDLLGDLPCDRTADALLAANVQRALPRFLRFCLMSRQAPLDGFVFEVRGSHYALDLSATVLRVLSAFSAADPARANCLARRVGPGRGWYFQFAGEAIFVTSFASQDDTPQTCGAPESCFIVFQLEESFRRHGCHDGPWASLSDLQDVAGTSFPARPRRRFRNRRRDAESDAEQVLPSQAESSSPEHRYVKLEHQVEDLEDRLDEMARHLQEIMETREAAAHVETLGQRSRRLQLQVNEVTSSGEIALRQELSSVSEDLTALFMRVEDNEHGLQSLADALSRVCEELSQLKARCIPTPRCSPAASSVVS